MLVDDDIYEKMLCLGPWYKRPNKTNIYAAKKLTRGLAILAHRQAGVLYGILKSLDDPHQIDHINHNGLDNRRVNLRAVENRDNARNRIKNPGLTSKFRGVSRHRRGRKWSAAITYDGKHHHLGRFDNEIDAAKAFDAVARQLGYVEFSLNFPGEIENNHLERKPFDQGQDSRNRRKREGGTSKYKGVSWNRKNHGWMVRICFHGDRIYLGCFNDETEAGRAFDSAARKLGYSESSLNFTA